jgi:hypothetical protein
MISRRQKYISHKIHDWLSESLAKATACNGGRPGTQVLTSAFRLMPMAIAIITCAYDP